MITIEFLRQFRLMDYAIFDLVASFIGIYLLAPFLSKIFLKFGLKISRKSWMFLTLPISIITHLLAGEMTLMTRNFIDPQGYFVLKVLIVTLFILGIRDIEVVKNKKKVQS